MGYTYGYMYMYVGLLGRTQMKKLVSEWLKGKSTLILNLNRYKKHWQFCKKYYTKNVEM